VIRLQAVKPKETFFDSQIGKTTFLFSQLLVEYLDLRTGSKTVGPEDEALRRILLRSSRLFNH
jgi:hypothetical protein